MATENLEEGTEVTPAAFQDLQKRLEKAEKKLAKAKSQAKATMQEIWQLDVKLKEEEERAKQAEARLAELQESGGQAAPAAELEPATSEELEALQAELKEARSEAAQVVELQELVEDLKSQLAQLQDELAQRSEPVSAVDPEELRKLEERVAELEEEKSTLQVDLQVRIAELENQLEAATAEQAPAESQEELDSFRQRIVELEGELEALRANEGDSTTEAELEAELESHPTVEAPALAVSPEVDFLEARMSGLRIALHEAEERARVAEAGSLNGGGVALVSEDEEGSETLVLELQDRVSELETELAEARQGEGGDGDESEELRRELMEAQDRISELESRAGVSIEEYQRLEAELEEFKNELEEANKRADVAAGGALGAAVALAAGDDGEKLSEYKERLELADQRAELLQQKAESASQRAEEFKRNLEELGAERERLAQQLQEAEARHAELSRALEAKSAMGGGGESIGLAGGDSRLQDALKRAREAELKANQAEIQLQKAMESLSDYEQRANESDRETQRLAFQDALTGLPNLNLIRQYLEFTVKQVQRYSRASALLVVDLDRFKLINDSMGFKAGDELLMKVAERLQTAIRESDALGRKGEDEFLILLSELITGDDDAPPEQKTNMIRQNIAIVVNRISECLSRPFTVQGQKFYIRASIGVSICPNDADSAQAMLEHADMAMYHAKESGRGRCVFYNNELHKRQERRLTMDSQLRLAMEKGEFVLQYQPIIEITKGKGQIVGVEALLRWNHRIDGLLEPASFLGIAEETGLICQLGQWVCRQSCWQLRQWLAQGHNLFVSFNVSTRQMLQADLAEMILSSVDEFGLQPGLVFVELSEGSNVEEVDLIERVVANLGRAGIRVAIDDFGVGYSSLSRIDLKHIQFLKVDPSLVNGCQQDRAKANICEAAVKLAQSLELRPLAEGVETMAQAKFLTKIGCQFLQGYHIQAPADAQVITNLLNEKKAWKF